MSRYLASCSILLAFADYPAFASYQVLESPNSDQGQSSTQVNDATEDEIIITATRSGSRLEDLPVSVSVVDRATLEGQLIQNRNVLSALEFTVPGISVQDSESRGSCNSAIRGRAASFQINGVPVNEDLRPGACTGPFTISPFAIERVEVVRGGTALYGAGAPGGIVNFITRRAAGETFEVDAVAQSSFNTETSRDTFTTDLFLGAGQQVGAFDYYVGGGFTDGGRVRSGSGAPVFSSSFDAFDLLASLGYDLGGGQRLQFTGTYHDEDLGRQFYPDGSIDPDTGLANIVEVDRHPQADQAHDRNLTMALSYCHPSLLGHVLDASLFFQQQSLKQRDNFYTAEFGNDFFASNRNNRRIGLRTALVRSYEFGRAALKTTYGFDFTRNDFRRFQVDAADGERVNGYISPAIYLNTYALFGQLELGLGNVTLSGGLRHEWYRGAITDRGYDPSLPRAATPGKFAPTRLALWNAGATYALTDTVQLYAGFSQGAELSELGRAARGAADPGLISPEPATSDQYEIGVRGKLRNVEFGLAAYHSRSESSSQIQPDPSCAGESFCPLIPLRVPERFKGVEANARWSVSPSLALSGVFTLQRGKIFDEDRQEFIAYGTDAAVPLRVTGRAEWSPLERLALAAQVTHYGASSYFSPSEEEVGLVDTDAVTLASASVRYTIGKATLTLAADNLFDKRYVSVARQAEGVGGFSYAEAPGRRVTIGVSGRF